MILSLAFLPVDKVEDGVKALLGEVREELEPIVRWFEENYVKKQTGGFKTLTKKRVQAYCFVVINN